MTGPDSGDFGWHDCHVWGVSLRVGDPELDDWTSDLVVDIDYIVEWLCGVGEQKARFRVAPADLVFHDVSDLTVDLAWSDTAGRVALSLPSIDAITREPIPNRKVHLGRPYYRWTIDFNWPEGGSIRFGASGFTQTLRAEPILSDGQRLRAPERVRASGS